MNVQSILTDAIYNSLQDRQFQANINAGYLDVALKTLNQILDEWRSYIPWEDKVTFTNVDDLTSSTFASVTNVNYVLQNVIMPLQEVNLTRFNELANIVNLAGIPEIYYFDPLAQTINVYPSPSNPAYEFTVWGRIQQVNLGQFDNIPANMPPFMVRAVTYELAFNLCAAYGAVWSAEKENIRQTSIAKLKRMKKIDLQNPLHSVFGRPGSDGVPPFPFFYYLSGGGS